MLTISFIWDNHKADENRKKHKISFEEAKTVFTDPNARMIFDPEHSTDEDRFVLLGISAALRLLAVCHCYREKRYGYSNYFQLERQPNKSKSNTGAFIMRNEYDFSESVKKSLRQAP